MWVGGGGGVGVGWGGVGGGSLSLQCMHARMHACIPPSASPLGPFPAGQPASQTQTALACLPHGVDPRHLHLLRGRAQHVEGVLAGKRHRGVQRDGDDVLRAGCAGRGGWVWVWVWVGWCGGVGTGRRQRLLCLRQPRGNPEATQRQPSHGLTTRLNRPPHTHRCLGGASSCSWGAARFRSWRSPSGTAG